MGMVRKGITSGGNIIVDYVKIIDSYPKQGNLSSILDISRSVGGAVPNMLINIAKMDMSVPLQAIGISGDDENGDYVLSRLEEHYIDTSLVSRHSTLGTSFTDVMSVRSTGERTFFHYRGANAVLNCKYFDFSRIKGEILHIAYALLLDGMDLPDQEYGTVMAKTLAKAQECGIKTSIDVVSENSDRFNMIVPPSLKYANYCVINEVEASMTTRIPARNDNGDIIISNIEIMCRKLFEMGVKDWVIIHCPEGGFGMNVSRRFHMQPSIDLPKDYIKGKVGAGDAFCGAILYSAYMKWPMEEALKIASGAAACNLSEANAIDGMKKIEEVKRFFDIMPKVRLQRF
jgi:sugar/nucleoside kinase (ribokinase family)